MSDPKASLAAAINKALLRNGVQLTGAELGPVTEQIFDYILHDPNFDSEMKDYQKPEAEAEKEATQPEPPPTPSPAPVEPSPVTPPVTPAPPATPSEPPAEPEPPIQEPPKNV